MNAVDGRLVVVGGERRRQPQPVRPGRDPRGPPGERGVPAQHVLRGRAVDDVVLQLLAVHAELVAGDHLGADLEGDLRRGGRPARRSRRWSGRTARSCRPARWRCRRRRSRCRRSGRSSPAGRTARRVRRPCSPTPRASCSCTKCRPSRVGDQADAAGRGIGQHLAVPLEAQVPRAVELDHRGEVADWSGGPSRRRSRPSPDARPHRSARTRAVAGPRRCGAGSARRSRRPRVSVERDREQRLVEGVSATDDQLGRRVHDQGRARCSRRFRPRPGATGSGPDAAASSRL